MSGVCFFYEVDSLFFLVVSLLLGLIFIYKVFIMMFLERVYGIEDQVIFFRILEDVILLDLRVVIILDIV